MGDVVVGRRAGVWMALAFGEEGVGEGKEFVVCGVVDVF